MPNNLPNGVGASLGDALVLAKPLAMSGIPLYVSSVLGDDGNSGVSRKDPKATAGSAVTAASAGDWIVLAADHDETLTSALNISKALTIVGEGSSSGLPTAKFTNNQAAAALFTIGATDVQLVNIFFEEQDQACSVALITCAVARFLMRGCYFQADGNSNAAQLQFNTGAGDVQVDSTTFISTSTAQATASNNDPPQIGIEVTAAMSDLRMTGTVFDGGTIGWADNALKASAAAVTRLRGLQMSFINGADYDLHASTTGYLNPATSTGDVVGNW